MRRLCAEAVALCHDVAPDVARGPLYVVLRADLPPEYRTADDCQPVRLDQARTPSRDNGV